MNEHLRSLHRALARAMPEKHEPPEAMPAIAPLPQPKPPTPTKPRPKPVGPTKKTEDAPGHWHGVPFEKWIGRTVKSWKMGRIGKATCPARIVEFKADGCVVIVPRNHGQPDTVELSTLRPWWAKNPDLKP